MSGLAKLLIHKGYDVSGSDLRNGPLALELTDRGIQYFQGHNHQNLQGVDLVVVSSAIQQDNPELLFAREQAIPVCHRAELLADLVKGHKSIGILGTHGKTTTSSMISFLLEQLGREPTCFVGGRMENFNDNVIVGGNEYWVTEVDESDGTQALFNPAYTLITNLEEDHLDHYGDLETIKLRFREFLDGLDPEGVVVIGDDCAHLRDVSSWIKSKKITYGLTPSADFRARNIRYKGFETEYELFRNLRYQGQVRLKMAGRHNVMNSLGAIALLASLDVDPKEVLPHLSNFKGAGRRLEIKWNDDSTIVIDDYAHHPTEIKATLAGLKACNKRITCVFQPHRYSRVMSMAGEFGKAFTDADRIILTEIYAAGETNTEGIDSSLIAKQIIRSGHPRVAYMEKEEVVPYLLERSLSNEVVAFLGAGDITQQASQLAVELRDRAQSQKAFVE